MCGILGVVATSPVNQLLYDGLMVLQHRGQDAAGIATGESDAFHMHKGSGLVRDVFRTRNMRALPGNMGIAHCRYPTAGSSSDSAESQPFYVNSPFGLVLAHNGNLTNTEQLQEEMFRQDLRHINTNSDSEVLLNVLAHELQESAKGFRLDLDTIFAAVAGVHRRCKGAYAVVVLIAGYGLLAFRDPYGIRPLVIGVNETPKGAEYLLASESVALDTLGYRVLRDVAPGEAVFVDMAHQMHHRQCAHHPVLSPCIFEYVYLARPDSVIDGVSVYETRLRMGEHLADKVARELPVEDIDVVIPIPDSSRPAAMQLAQRLGIPYREGYVKNRYIGRTFIMPGQSTRKNSVRQKLNTVGQEFKGKRVLLVDDSIVRGTTSREIVEMARAAGARKVYFASAAPPVRFPNVYGIDMPTRSELIATGRTDADICLEIGADALVYQDLDALKASVRELKQGLSSFDCSCFDGQYVTGDVTAEYLDAIEQTREGKIAASRVDGGDSRQLHLNLNSGR
ncbi:amidophosphoribosyltransferase [Propionivibrio sp.]|uniref:amidophosphoribosyltransferase n=1 Tax=Propionivibrio sp. TaxID=2212460 RepID=UPI0025E20F85|nr:amidophosphoribosyltransferase [Propionivibrio sp.]MBK7356737.1 amidophosphoribosyltransferase [Propionivibrio sp.]MBK8401148.1 amidophosphoribosyltransferase [Propionivibrio sp.]MBK8743680.1 amidophosphoribosyltransferase [Propionivibrio sp.]MBK8894919.1 amidophosphoribosyltransferase [Propionivibrio sp.]